MADFSQAWSNVLVYVHIGTCDVATLHGDKSVLSLKEVTQ